MVEEYDWSQYMLDSVAGVETSVDNPSANIIRETITDITKQYMFITLNSYKEINKFEYNKCIKEVMKIINKRYKTMMCIQWYFEISPSNRLHVHGMISNIPVTYWPYGKLCKDIAKEFHKRIGKARLAHGICCDVQWANSNYAVANYCSKNKGSEYILCPKA